ncbi:unnamed protein product [Microthlaspi erraticum]|uniref:Serpin domain-containing protein n=1 Tax=Microthlaspi erraticum TaxID=1685480 RepID=A0A6D2I3W3_9BRAS|nr:unnamed protein product [Microthlaspi erraticum]
MELGKSIVKQNDAVVRLAKHVITTVSNGSNVVFSPTSINVLLSLIAEGSSHVSKENILSFLMLPSTDHLNEVLAQIADRSETSDLRLYAAYGAWIDKSFSFKPSFKEILENSYNAKCSHVDFNTKPAEVIDEVNTWAEVNTNGLIKEVLTYDSVADIRSSSLVLANVVYFKGAWSKKFDSKLTENIDFHLHDGTSVHVPFMTNRKKQYLEEYEDLQVLRIPYVEDHRQFSMYIYLPYEKDGLPALLEKIVSEPGFLDNHIPLERVKVGYFRVPKFSFSYDFEASGVLKDMGLTSPFTPGGGSLTEMVDSDSNRENLYVSEILHKSCIVVDEEGTEAAAASGIRDALLCEVPDFVADHPFLFTVREDKTGVILFMGQILDPSKH